MTMADMYVSHSLFCDGKPGVAHCNFHLRGDESDADEVLVRSWADKNGLPFFKADFDTSSYAEANGISIEMAARDLRYEWFAQICRTEGYDAVAVAHNADDNAETLILNLLRGTGLKGICGMKAEGTVPGAPDVALLRPILDMTRYAIEEYARAKGLRWHEDRTNTDTTIKRNLVRHSIFPLFEKINPSFRRTLASDMEHFREAYESSIPGLSGELLDAGFSGSMVESITRHLKDNPHSSGRRFICGGMEAVTHNGELTIRRLQDGLAEESVKVDGPGLYRFAGRDISVELLDRTEDFPMKQPEGTIAMDAALVDMPLELRPWREGDRMRPFGMKRGSRKLSDIFSDLHYSIPQKESAPVLCDAGGRILGIAGIRIDDSVRITDETGLILVVKISI